MAKSEKSSKEMATLAGKVLARKSSSAATKRLAGSVLTQAADKEKDKPKDEKPKKAEKPKAQKAKKDKSKKEKDKKGKKKGSKKKAKKK